MASLWERILEKDRRLRESNRRSRERRIAEEKARIRGPRVPGSIAEAANRAMEKKSQAPTSWSTPQPRRSAEETSPVPKGNTPAPAPAPVKNAPAPAPKPKPKSTPPLDPAARARSILGPAGGGNKPLGEDNAVMRRLREREEARARGENPNREIGNEKLRNLMKSMGMKKGGVVSSASKRADGCASKGKTKGRYI